MPESNRTICALSAPVNVFADELMTELLRRLPVENCAEILQRVLVLSQDRLLAQTVRNRKSDAYKATLLARGMASRLPSIPEELAVLLGIKEAAQLPEVPEPAQESIEDFASLIDIPTFTDYADVFETYPFVKVRKDTPYGPLLILGYSSGRGKDSDKLYRRNCVVVSPNGKDVVFKNLVSVIGVMTHKGWDGTHYHIKAVPYVDGLGVRFWTNYIGEGDAADQYRYRLFTESGHEDFKNAASWSEALNSYAQPMIH